MSSLWVPGALAAKAWEGGGVSTGGGELGRGGGVDPLLPEIHGNHERGYNYKGNAYPQDQSELAFSLHLIIFLLLSFFPRVLSFSLLFSFLSLFPLMLSCRYLSLFD